MSDSMIGRRALLRGAGGLAALPLKNEAAVTKRWLEWARG